MPKDRLEEMERWMALGYSRQQSKVLTFGMMSKGMGPEEFMGVMADRIRATLLGAPRWRFETAQLPLMAVARVGRVRVEDWTVDEAREAVAWATEAAPLEPMPRVLATWLERVRRAEGGT